MSHTVGVMIFWIVAAIVVGIVGFVFFILIYIGLDIRKMFKKK